MFERYADPGAPLGRDNPHLATSHNALIEAVEELQVAVKRLGIEEPGEASENGSNPQLVRVYDGVNKTATVRCLPVSSTDETVGDTTADFIEVKPWDVSSVVSLESTGCCGDETGPVPSGIRVNVPEVDTGAIVVTGSGVAAEATVTVTISDGTTDLTPSVTNNGDGTFTAASQALSTLDDGLVTVAATDGATTQTVGIVWQSSPPAGTAPQTPDPPDMQSASDSGASSTDNVTDDTTPTFDVTCKDVPDATGPVPALLVDAEVVQTGTASSFNSALTIGMTPSSARTEAKHTAQVVLFFDNAPTPSAAFGDMANDLYSAASDKLEFTIDSTATESESAARVNRAGLLQMVDVAGTVEKRLLVLSTCTKENTSAENTKLDA